MEENKRLRELKLSLYINHIDKAPNKDLYSMLLKLLNCIAATIGENAHKSFIKLIQLTVGGSLLRANNKELVACFRTYFSDRAVIRRLGVSGNYFYKTYNDLLNRNFKTKEYLDSLKPIFDKSEDSIVIKTIINFIENFKYELGREEHDLMDSERTLELEFLLIYNKLIEVFNNVGFCDKLIYNICNVFDIDYSSIAQLKNKIHIINRSYPNFRYNNRYLMQELVTLYTHKGLSKGTIGSKVLGKTSSYLYNGTNKKYKVMSKDELSWQYVKTIDWELINKSAVIKFINLFHTFIRYDV